MRAELRLNLVRYPCCAVTNAENMGGITKTQTLDNGVKDRSSGVNITYRATLNRRSAALFIADTNLCLLPEAPVWLALAEINLDEFRCLAA
ncbi:MAG: hypothetical protein FWD68_03635 [Alphaproteobacteria bacterium]|nr:hypothetical protein [Alphaproteobacteria bacterium]